MSKIRIKRLESELTKLIGNVFNKKIRDKNLQWVTISDVDLSPDLQHAKIYFTYLEHKVEPEIMLKHKSKTKRITKNEITKKKMMRTIPEIRYIYEDTEDKAQRIEHLLKELKKDD